MNRVDQAALKLAIEAARQESPARAQQIDRKLASESLEKVGRFAASCAQSAALDLKPWEICPADFHPSDLDDPRKPRGARRAHALLQKMERLGISRWHPDPLAAIAEAERSASSAK